MSKNDVTGDEIITKNSTESYRDNYDLIFGKPRMKISMKISKIDIMGVNGEYEHDQEVSNPVVERK